MCRYIIGTLSCKGVGTDCCIESYNYESNANSLLNLALSLICSNKNNNDMLTGTDNINHEHTT